MGEVKKLRLAVVDKKRAEEAEKLEFMEALADTIEQARERIERMRKRGEVVPAAQAELLQAFGSANELLNKLWYEYKTTPSNHRNAWTRELRIKMVDMFLMLDMEDEQIAVLLGRTRAAITSERGRISEAYPESDITDRELRRKNGKRASRVGKDFVEEGSGPRSRQRRRAKKKA